LTISLDDIRQTLFFSKFHLNIYFDILCYTREQLKNVTKSIFMINIVVMVKVSLLLEEWTQWKRCYRISLQIKSEKLRAKKAA